MLIAHVLLLPKETPEFIPLQLWPPNSPDLNPVCNSTWEILQETVYRTRITDLELSPSRCFSSSRSMMRIFKPSLVIFLTCCNHVNSNLASLGPQLRWDGVFFCYNSVVARVRRAFQVSQVSVESRDIIQIKWKTCI